MLKIIKWDFVGYIRRHYWLYVVFAAALILSVLPKSLPVSDFFDGLAAGLGVVFFILSVIFSIGEPIGWLRKKSAQLELSLPVKPWKKLLGKVILSACIIVSTMLLSKLLELQAGQFKADLFSNAIVNAVVFVQFLVCMLTVVTSFMFSYITAKSFAPTRSIAGLIAVLIFLGIYALIIFLAFVPMNFTIQHAEVTTVYNQSFIINTPDTGIQDMVSILAPLALSILFFFASSALLKKRFERY